MQEIIEVHQALKSGADIVVGDDPWVKYTIYLLYFDSDQFFFY